MKGSPVKTGMSCLLIFGGALGLLAADPPQHARQELEAVLRELRELRSGYYERTRARRRNIEAIRSEIHKLRENLRELNETGKKLDADLEAIRTETNDLEKQKNTFANESREVAKAMTDFSEYARQRTEEGIPYRIEARTHSVESSTKKDMALSERLAGLWTFFQDELRISRSGETYTETIRLPDGREKPSRVFRVGNQVLGFVTEDGLETGLWFEGTGWVTDRARVAPGSVRTAVEILDRRRTPEWVSLPVRLPTGRPK